MRCDKCNVEIGESNICPLCHENIQKGEITIIKSEYPPKQAKRPLPMRISPKTIFLIIAVIAATICILVNYLTDTTYLWCWFMTALFGYCYLTIANTICSETEIGAKILLQGATLVALSYIYDAIFRMHIATGYCVPIIISLMIVSSVASLIAKYKYNRSLFVSCNIISVLGFIPIILYACKLTDILIPAIVCAVVGGISLICSLSFNAKRLKEQYSKVFHM